MSTDWRLELYAKTSGEPPKRWTETDFTSVLAHAREGLSRLETHTLRIMPPDTATASELRELAEIGIEPTFPPPRER